MRIFGPLTQLLPYMTRTIVSCSQKPRQFIVRPTSALCTSSSNFFFQHAADLDKQFLNRFLLSANLNSIDYSITHNMMLGSLF